MTKIEILAKNPVKCIKLLRYGALISGILAVGGSMISTKAASNNIDFNLDQLEIDGELYEIEIASSSSQRQQGLMFRKGLYDRQGMLFVYPGAGYHRIWMKNTLIPLTVIWIDESQKIIEIKILSPCQQDPCPSYGPSIPSRYVLELNESEHGIKKGDRIDGLIRFQ